MPSAADPTRLEAHVRALEGERHPRSSPRALRAAQDYLADSLSSLGLAVERRPFPFRGRAFENVVATAPGRRTDRPRVAVAAHFDTVQGTLGADDNASGVAALLEAARLLAADDLASAVEFIGFNLEESQGLAGRVGSRAFVAEARRQGLAYAAALVLEMVGYTDPAPGSQRRPAALFWKRMPRRGTFLAATGDSGSRRLLRAFAAVARAEVPDLEVVTFRSPSGGWLVPETRLSDNASFWDEGYPALMLTDTAFFRNPHYHLPSDRADTLDYRFLAEVTQATVACVRALAGGAAG